jgi:glutamate-1-semialdehyde aminotransferase
LAHLELRVEVLEGGDRVRLVDVAGVPAEPLCRRPPEEDGLRPIELEFCATGYGSLVGLHFARGPVRSERDVPESAELRGLLHLHMLERGFSYGRHGFIALSLPLGEAEIDRFAAAVEEFLATV